MIHGQSVRRTLSNAAGLWVIAAVSCIALPLTSASAQSNSAASTVTSDPVLASWKNQASVAACAQCHLRGANEFAGEDSATFSRLTELQFWLQNDKHAIARRRVEPLSKNALLEQAELISERLDGPLPADWLGESNVLSKRICDKLGYEVTTVEGYRKFQENCMTCHGGYRGDATEKLGFERPVLDPFTSQPGISCNYCHQVGNQTQWIAKHGVPDAAKSWRTQTPAQKLALGMRDLVNATNQSDLCLDCHIGNRKQNQFVTHEMYAAGHPPLPSIELQTFCDQMPGHWQSLSQLHDSLAKSPTRDAYFAVNFPGLIPNSKGIDGGKMYWNTRQMLIGAIVARMKSTELYVDAAVDDAWADYALYDCAACHHELQIPSVRQYRGYPAAPGRPRQHEWPQSLLHTALLFSQVAEAPNSLEQLMQTQFGETPFGDPRQIAGTAVRLNRALESALRAAQQKPIDAAMARNVLLSLARTNENQLVTYDAARQIAWAMQLVAQEMSDEGSPLSPEIQSLIDSLSSHESDPAADAGGTGIDTKLPSGRQVFIYPRNLQADLARRAKYDRTEFVNRLRELNRKITNSPRSASLMITRPQP